MLKCDFVCHNFIIFESMIFFHVTVHHLFKGEGGNLPCFTVWEQQSL